jgi:hypothetical protein
MIRTEDRRQKTEDREQKTEDRGQKTDDSGRKFRISEACPIPTIPAILPSGN